MSHKIFNSGFVDGFLGKSRNNFSEESHNREREVYANGNNQGMIERQVECNPESCHMVLSCSEFIIEFGSYRVRIKDFGFKITGDVLILDFPIASFTLADDREITSIKLTHEFAKMREMSHLIESVASRLPENVRFRQQLNKLPSVK